MLISLTLETQQRLAALFALADRRAATDLLTDECGDNLGCGDPAGSILIERIRFAALKLSGGDLELLRRAVDLAKLDWRDLLMAAGFGYDFNAHKGWWPGPDDGTFARRTIS